MNAKNSLNAYKTFKSIRFKEHILNMLNEVFIIIKNILLYNDYTITKYSKFGNIDL